MRERTEEKKKSPATVLARGEVLVSGEKHGRPGIDSGEKELMLERGL